MTAEPMGDAAWSSARRCLRPIDGCHELVAGSTEELVVREPFEIRLPSREIAP